MSRDQSYPDLRFNKLYRDTSFINDSIITLELKAGSIVSFPVSSERDRDVKFYDAIQERIGE